MFNNYEIVEYTHSLPFQIRNFTGRTIQDDRGDIKDVLEHWHQEIEIVYTFEGYALHYIDGKIHRAAPGKLFITNSESIHKVISDKGTLGMPKVIAVVLLINVDFVKKLVPDLEQMYFLPEADSDMEVIGQLMKEFSDYAERDKEYEPYENLIVAYFCVGCKKEGPVGPDLVTSTKFLVTIGENDAKSLVKTENTPKFSQNSCKKYTCVK